MYKPEAGRLAFPLLIALIVIAFLFGGGGIGAPLGNLTVQLAALAILAFVPQGAFAFWRESPIALRGLIAATLALPVLQVFPLPESMWTSLPSRDLVTASMRSAGAGGWMPFSLDPRRTLLAATALIAPLAVLCVGWSLPRNRLIDTGWLIVVLGIVSVVLGAFQLGAAPGGATLYGGTYGKPVLVGTFANRNSAGLFLAFALGLAALLPAPRRHPAALVVRIAVCALLLLGVVLTQSRTAMVLALLPALLGAARGFATLFEGRAAPSDARSIMIAVGAIALVASAAGALVVAVPGRIGEAVERFEAKDDARRFIWDDATFSAERYWPLGAGMGTFDEIYQLDESLENLTARRAGRAHNDFIELTIEAGAPGLILVCAWLLLLGWVSWRARLSVGRWPAWAGSAFVLMIALQSITDYPLRNQTVLVLAAYALLLLARMASSTGRVRT